VQHEDHWLVATDTLALEDGIEALTISAEYTERVGDPRRPVDADDVAPANLATLRAADSPVYPVLLETVFLGIFLLIVVIVLFDIIGVVLIVGFGIFPVATPGEGGLDQIG
jgi:hypothetical protein